MPETEVKMEQTNTAETADEKIKNAAPKKARKPRTNPDGTPVKRASRKGKTSKKSSSGASGSSRRRKNTALKKDEAGREAAAPSANPVEETKTDAAVNESAAESKGSVTNTAAETPAAPSEPETNDKADSAEEEKTADAVPASETVKNDGAETTVPIAEAESVTEPAEKVTEAKDETDSADVTKPEEETATATDTVSETVQNDGTESTASETEIASVPAEETAASEPEDTGASVSEAESSPETVETVTEIETEPETKDETESAVAAESAEETAAGSVSDAEAPASKSEEKETETASNSSAANTGSSAEVRKEEPQIPFQQTVRFANVEERDFEPKIVRELGSDPAKTSVLKGLYDPISNMLAQASTAAHNDWKYALLRIVLKYGIIAFFFVYVLQAKLNSDSFSFARMPFTNAASLWARIVAFGTITEYAAACLKMFLGSFRFSLSNLLRLADISCENAWFLTLLYSLASLAMNVSPYFSFIIVTAAFASSILLHAISYEYTFQCGRRRSVLACVCTALLTSLLIGLWIRWFGGDLIRIVNSFITL